MTLSAKFYADRYQRRYGDKGKSAQFKEGYDGWATHQPLPNPYAPDTKEAYDFSDGAYWAEFDYDEDRER